jgi:hypothetical protein
MALPRPVIHTKHLSQVLPRVSEGLRTETFDPTNSEHLDAFTQLVFGGKQHPTLRFHLDRPFLDVRAMMHDRVARAYLAQHGYVLSV